MSGPIQTLANQQFYKNKPEGLSAIQPPAAYGLTDYKEIALTYGKGQSLQMWERSVGKDKPTIVVFHGINGHWGEIHGAGNEGAHQMRIEWLKSLPQDVNVIAVSMPGFGKSTGEPSRSTFDAANHALVDELLKKRGIDPKTITAKGESMGANHALNFARQAFEKGSPIAQVDAIVPFTTSGDAAKDLLSAYGKPIFGQLSSALLTHSDHRHDNLVELAKLKGSGTKIMVLSAGNEAIVSPPAHQKKLAFASAKVGLCTTLVTDPSAHHTSWDKAKAQAESAKVAGGECRDGEPMEITLSSLPSAPKTRTR